MTGKFIFYLTAERFSAYSWQNGRLMDEHVFTNDAAGHERFSEYLPRVGKKPAYLLVDLVEEDYRFDRVPHLIGPERTALFNRKLEQHYRNSPFRHALVQGRHEDGRRDDQVLFSALTNPELITPWIELMLAQSVAIAGVYSAALIAKQLLKGFPSHHLLLITWQKHAGLRQTYFQTSNLSFSRLTPLAHGDNLVDKIVAESARTLQYLNSLSLLPPDRPLEVCILCGNRDRQELQGRLSSTPSLRYVFRDVRETAHNLDPTGEAPGDSDATLLLLQMLGRSPLPNQYAAPDHTHYFSLLKIRQFMNRLSLVVGLLAALTGAFYLWSANQMERRIDELTNQTRSFDVSYRRIAQDFPPAPTSAANMQAAVELAGKLAALTADPQRALKLVGHALEAFPAIQLNGLTWYGTFDPDNVKSEYAAGGEPPAQEARPPAAGGATAAAGDTRFRVIFLQGEIAPFDNNYRRAIDIVNGFREALEKTGATATVLALPLDLRSQGTVSSETDQQETARRAVFVLKLVWKQA